MTIFVNWFATQSTSSFLRLEAVMVRIPDL
jgi:hypothetical protein